MAFRLLDSTTIRRILDALHPRFIGRDQDHLIALADESGAIAYEAAQAYVQPLYDFRNDIQSTAGAGMVGIEDAADSFTATDVEGALAELDTGLTTHTHDDRYYTESEVDTALATKSNVGHTHDDRYYTESETNTLLAAKAPLASPAFTGTPTAPTPLTSDNSTKLATTAWVTGKGYTSNTGTVTNVAVTGGTGLTVGGSPISTSGTITLSLSANLQSWSGISPSSKQDSSANLTSWSAISPATKADDSAVVHLTGTETISGTKNFTGTLQSGGVEVGFRTLQMTSQNADYTLTTDNIDKCVLHTTTTSHTYTVPSMAAGSVITVCHSGGSGTLTLTGSGCNLYLAGSTGGPGNRTIAPRGVASLMFITSTVVIVGGPGVT